MYKQKIRNINIFRLLTNVRECPDADILSRYYKSIGGVNHSEVYSPMAASQVSIRSSVFSGSFISSSASPTNFPSTTPSLSSNL